MIRYREKIELTPYGRDVKELKADFIGGECPSWLILPSGCAYSDNGVDIPENGVLKTINMPLLEMDAIGIQLNNLRLSGNENQTPYPTLSIKLVHLDSNGLEAESIGLYGGNKQNWFAYTIGGTDVYTDDVGVYLGDTHYSVLVDTDISPYYSRNYYRYANRPKNLGMLVLPIMGCLHGFFNNIPVYSKFNLEAIEYTLDGVEHNGVDFTTGQDSWRFEITSNKSMHMSSVDLLIHQSY